MIIPASLRVTGWPLLGGLRNHRTQAQNIASGGPPLDANSYKNSAICSLNGGLYQPQLNVVEDL